MNGLLFEWDQNKSILNQKKNNISFEEARTVFLDDNALLIESRTIPKRKIGLFFLVLAFALNFWWYAIVIDAQKM